MALFMNIVGLPALVDTYENYIWVIHNNQQAWVVDPGEAQPVVNYLQQNDLQLAGILITHKHGDHVNGINQLVTQCATVDDLPIYGSALTPLAAISHPLQEGDAVTLNDNLTLKVLFTPGHTEDHIAFYNEKVLFCGDTLFTAGCGRILGGTVEQFSDSILKLRELPDDIAFYCGHEYTQTNLAFSQLVEPENQALLERIENTHIDYPQILTAAQSLLGEEKATNPFMRFDLSPLKERLIERGAANNPTSLFATLRAWKDDFDRTH